jgi:hypothetical protein
MGGRAAQNDHGVQCSFSTKTTITASSFVNEYHWGEPQVRPSRVGPAIFRRPCLPFQFRQPPRTARLHRAGRIAQNFLRALRVAMLSLNSGAYQEYQMTVPKAGGVLKPVNFR